MIPNREVTSKNSDSVFLPKASHSTLLTNRCHKQASCCLFASRVNHRMTLFNQSRRKSSGAESKLPSKDLKTFICPVSLSSCLKAPLTTDQLSSCFFGWVRHSVLLSSVKHHKEWGSLCLKTYLKYFYGVCVGPCPGTEPEAAVCSCTRENLQHAWPPTDTRVKAFHTNKWQSYDCPQTKAHHMNLVIQNWVQDYPIST